MAPQETKKSVVVSPMAVTSMMLHAVKHQHEVVHGVLLGSFEDDGKKIKVSESVPVCHGAPTLPLLETSLGLIESINKSDNSKHSAKAAAVVVVGWYVSPRLLNDEKPGPAALKIVSSLSASDEKNNEPTLIVVRNNNLDKLLLGEEGSLDDSVKAFGKDFGRQWLEPLQMSFDSKATAAKTIQEAFRENMAVIDLMDHLESDPMTAEKWYPNENLKTLVKARS